MATATAGRPQFDGLMEIKGCPCGDEAWRTVNLGNLGDSAVGRCCL